MGGVVRHAFVKNRFFVDFWALLPLPTRTRPMAVYPALFFNFWPFFKKVYIGSRRYSNGEVIVHLEYVAYAKIVKEEPRSVKKAVCSEQKSF